MTPRRAWALLALAGLALALTPLAGLAAALVAVAACAALCGLAALQARDTLREARLSALADRLTLLQEGAAADSRKVAEMWRVYQGTP